VKFKGALEKRFEIKTKVIGQGSDEVLEARVLNRVIRVGGEGWEYEPDQRHAELIVEGMGLTDAKEVSTPGEDEKKWEEEENDKKLESIEATKFRRVAARANYLAADRVDIMYAVKEICREMAAPTIGGKRKLKRLARYLKGRPRATLKYEGQGREGVIEGFTDSDWAGCRRTGKSTSGGVLMIGGHFIKGWSRTQNSVTLSSAEAELVALCKLSAELLGVMSMARDWRDIFTGDVFADSSAALAITKRKGSGKLRHINVGLLWVQQQAASKELAYQKVAGESNPADLMTKYLTAGKSGAFCEMVKQVFPSGRADAALKVQSGQANNEGLVA
jgi:hypothetical protein